MQGVFLPEEYTRIERGDLTVRRDFMVSQLTLPAGITAPEFSKGNLFFVGTATVILRYAGLTILTDPNFLHQGDHVHLGYGIRSRRLTNPAIGMDELPPVDFVLLSHLHEDHFDRLVMESLDRSLPIVTTTRAAKALQGHGFHAAIPLVPWETLTVDKGAAQVGITAMPGRHGPGPLSALLPPVMGSLLEFRGSGGRPLFRIYVTGDTLVFDELAEIPRRYPNIDLALLHLGGTRVAGVLLTMDADQGVRLVQIVMAKVHIPIHYNDYTVLKSSLEDFRRAVKAAGLEGRVHYLRHGDTYEFEVGS